MKKILKLLMITVVGISAMLMSGCSSNKLEVEKHVQNETMATELDGAPKWVMSHGEDETKLYGVGIAEPTAGDISFQRNMAMASGRDEIARSINIKVKNMLKSFKEKTGMKSNTTYDRVATDVSKQITSQTLIGSQSEDWWISKSGNLYILVSVPKESIKKEIIQKTNSSFKNNEALWQKFQSKQAQDELEAEVEKQL